MNQHHDQVEANIPELSGMVPASFKEIIQFNPLVASFRGSPLVVHAMPLITIPGRRGIETEVGVHRNGAGSANFKFNTGYFMMGKNGAYLTLPTFDFDVEKIVLTGRAAASTSTGMNIYVGEKAVSTATTGCTGTNTYEIASDYQSAGNAYTIKVTSSHNAQITKIEVYEVSSDPGTETDPNAPGTETTPYTVAQARAAIDAGTGVTGVYATGIVSKIVTPYNEKFGNISYNISADGTTEGDQLEAYRGFGKEGAWFTSADDIQVGDEVVIYGNLTKYNSTYEFAEGNQLVSLKRAAQEKKEAGIAYETTEFTITVGDEFTAPTLTNPNGLTVSYAGDNDKLATVDAARSAGAAVCLRYEIPANKEEKAVTRGNKAAEIYQVMIGTP